MLQYEQLYGILHVAPRDVYIVGKVDGTIYGQRAIGGVGVTNGYEENFN